MPTVAIVGASTNPDRPSHQAVLGYAAAGYTVWPVHPSGIAVAGHACFRSLAELPGKPDIISLYVNPQAGLAMLDQIVAAAPGLLWLNPGAESDELIAAAQARGLSLRVACNLVALRSGALGSEPN